MADSHDLTSSLNSLNLSSESKNHSLKTVKSNVKTDNLIISDNQIQWDGNLKSLKCFISNTLNTRGKWKSPGGNVKVFTSSNEEFIFKWHGAKSKNITILEDTDNKFFETLKSHSFPKKYSSTDQVYCQDDQIHKAMSLILPTETTEATDSDKESEELVINDVEGKLGQILARLHNLEEKSRTESNERAVLIADNMKMAAQIEQLKSTISLLREDNDRILSLLDAKQKQNAWIDVERTKQSNINQSKSITYPFPVENRFENLPVEDCDGDQALPTVSAQPTETINT